MITCCSILSLDWYDIQARQYDAIGVPGWNAIDPLSEKYYSISPYAYCGGNPVNFGDYDGRDIFKYDYQGNQIGIEKNNEFDQVTVSLEDGSTTAGNQYKTGTITNIAAKGGSILKINGDAAGTEVFEFLADNTIVEFGQVKTGEDQSGPNFVSTKGAESLNTIDGHKKGPNGDLLRSGLIKIDSVREVNHSHPGGSNPSPADLNMAKTYSNIVFNVYLPEGKQINGVKYLPFTNGEQRWLELFYSFPDD